MISFRLDDPRAHPGETIRGAVAWNSEKKSPKAVEIIAQLVTEGRGSKDTVRVFERTIDDPLEDGTAEFEFAIPLDAPCTYDGQLIRVKWQVEVRLHLPWAVDERMEVPFAVVS